MHELRLDDDPRPDLLQAVDDHPLARLQAVLDRPQPVVQRPHADRAGDDLVLVVDDVEDLLALVVVEGAVADQQGLVGRADGHPDAGEEARGERLVLVGEHAADAQGAGLRVDLVVHEVDRALVGKPLLGGQAQRHGPGRLVGRLGLAFADQLPDALDGALVHVEVGVHRVDRHDRGQQGAAALVARLDQVAHRDDVAADAPADRRGDLRVVQVQLGKVAGWPRRHARLATASR